MWEDGRVCDGRNTHRTKLIAALQTDRHVSGGVADFCSEVAAAWLALETAEGAGGVGIAGGC